MLNLKISKTTSVAGLILVGLLFTYSQAAMADQAQKPIFKLGVYEDSKCTKLKDESAVMSLDTSKSCQTIYYTDSRGKSTPATMGNYRCYKDKLVFDKYPLQDNCNGTGQVSKDYSVSFNCQSAPSYKGTVYEKLIEYQYPGNEDCSLPKSNR